MYLGRAGGRPLGFLLTTLEAVMLRARQGTHQGALIWSKWQQSGGEGTQGTMTSWFELCMRCVCVE